MLTPLPTGKVYAMESQKVCFSNKLKVFLIFIVLVESQVILYVVLLNLCATRNRILFQCNYGRPNILGYLMQCN